MIIVTPVPHIIPLQSTQGAITCLQLPMQLVTPKHVLLVIHVVVFARLWEVN
jgi:hypothetical protein